MLPKRPTSSSPIQNTELRTAWLRGSEWLGKQQSGLRTERDTDPTNNFADDIKKSTHEPLWLQGLWIPMIGPQAPPILCIPDPHTTPLTFYLVASSAPKPVRVTLCRWLVSTWESLTNSAGLGETAETWTCSTALAKIKRRLLVLGLTMQDVQKAYNPKKSPQKRTRSVEQVYPWNRLEKASESLIRLMGGFLS